MVRTILGVRYSLILLAVLSANFSGCMLAPGLTVDAEPSMWSSSTDPVDEGDYVLIPVTSSVLKKLEADAVTTKRAVPEEWVVDSSTYDYRIGPSDILQIWVWEHPELSTGSSGGIGNTSGPDSSGAAGGGSGTIAGSKTGTGAMGLRVNRDGTLFFPYLGKIPVAGRTVDEVRNLVTQGLARYITDPQVDVKVADFRSKKVNIVGDVGKPSYLPITDVPLRLVDAINGTGGATKTADLEDVRLIRKGKQARVSVLDILDNQQSDSNLLLQDGDLVYVSSVMFKKIYVAGEVMKQGVMALEAGRLALLAAVQESGGFNNDMSKPEHLMVIRAGKEKPLVYHVDASKAEGLLIATRFPLQQNDIVYVPPSKVAKVGKVLRSVLQPIMQPATMIGAFAR